MPHVSSTGGDDLGSTDEVKVFKDEGDGEDEKRSSEKNLTEEKSSLIDLTESEEKSGSGIYINSSHKNVQRSDHSPVFAKETRRRNDLDRSREKKREKEIAKERERELVAGHIPQVIGQEIIIIRCFALLTSGWAGICLRTRVGQ
ncbi:unnamed protein product [Phaedon cochleariae]|uniref:CTNNB1 binding N-teminal domain-containing protein n=1 Tax=Phaedon cochleariae TaxID=80249 RepID=A0A9N9SDT7_PHACE|nr:unnamed protein product [Phaedon cochleariae]